MRGAFGRMRALFVVASLCGVPQAHAVVRVVFGESWDGPSKNLQVIVDALYGTGKINVKTDYLGARSGDPDPWLWVDGQLSTLLVKEVAGNADYNQLGWYQETGSMPVLHNDGIRDGMIFDGPSGAGATAIVSFANRMTPFGFYLNPNGPGDVINAPEPEKFYTNRMFNDRGPDGSGNLHDPWGGDMQALVFDISRFQGANTWLVCFEDLDSGANPGPLGQAQTDNDYNDFIFEVTAYGATPVSALSFGGLKAMYTH